MADPLDFSTIKFHCIFSNQLDVDQNHDSNDHSKHSRTVVVLDALGVLSARVLDVLCESLAQRPLNEQRSSAKLTVPMSRITMSITMKSLVKPSNLTKI